MTKIKRRTNLDLGPTFLVITHYKTFFEAKESVYLNLKLQRNLNLHS